MRKITLLAAALLLSGVPQAWSMDDAAAIHDVLTTMFDRPESRLSLAPPSIEADAAVVGWVQGEFGGRALLRKHGDNWRIELCGGDAGKDASALTGFGVAPAQALILSRRIADTEASLDHALIEKFSRFDGIMRIDADDSASSTHRAGH